jgi:hypothetical protein
VYGLRVRSELPLPELLPDPGDDPPDIELRLGDRGDGPAQTSPLWSLPAADPGDYHPAMPGTLPIHMGRDAQGDFADVLWDPIGRCVARTGAADGMSRVTLIPAAHVPEDMLRLMLLGPIIGIVLHLRGWLVLHASAVEVTGGAIAILGDTGRGKSTTAAVLAAHGHRLVADDVVAIPPGAPDAPVTTVPGFPQLKLWPDAATAVAGDADALPRLVATAEKRAQRVPEHFSAAPLPLRTVFVLDAGPDDRSDAPPPPPEVASHDAPLLAPADAFIELVRHAYGARTFERVDAARRFAQMGRVAATVPARRLRVRRGFEHLPALVALIESVA